MSKTATAARLEARLPPEVHAVIRRAADLEGRSVTDFVVDAAFEAAKKSIEEIEVIRLNAADSEFFAEMLLNPPKPTEALVTALAEHKRRVISK